MSKDSSNPGLQRPRRYPAWWDDLPWSWGESLVLAVLALFATEVVLSLAWGLLLPPAPVENIVASFGFYAASRLGGMLLILWFLWRRGTGLKSLGFRRFKLGKSFKRLLGAVLLLLVLSQIGLLLAEQLLPEVDFTQEQEIVFLEAEATRELVLAFIALVIIAPVVEETFFRGLLLPAFARRFGLGAAVVITSVLFGLVHVEPAAVVVTGVMGLLLAWLYYRSGSLWPAILFHSLKNLVAYILIFANIPGI